jgi:prepilin signal peptidase PulO-like enzyme (type II secretory pathway)
MYLGLIILFGLSFGSFLNVIIYRLPEGTFFAQKRSFCPKCKTQIPIYRNIPLLSFLFQKGKCHNCKQSISLQYPLVELLSGLIWLWAFVNYGLAQGILFIWICSVLLAISFIDLKTFIIPLPLVISGILGLIIYIFIHPQDWRVMFWGGVFGVSYLSLVFLLTSAIFKKQTMGFGDLQLVLITGMWLGPVNVLLSIFLSSILALIVWISISMIKGVDRNRPLAFGPYLSVSAIIVYMVNIDVLRFLS